MMNVREKEEKGVKREREPGREKGPGGVYVEGGREK